MTRMREDQPAWMLRDTDERANVAAVLDLLGKVRAPRTKVLREFFGGIGGVTTAALRHFPSVRVETWDLDAKCLVMIQQRLEREGLLDRADIRQGDSLANLVVRPGDGVLADFNRLTLLKARGVYREALDRMFGAKADWVQLADAAVSKLHLNFPAYGLARPSHDDYVSAWADYVRATYRYTLVGASGHTRATMLMFVREASVRRPGA